MKKDSKKDSAVSPVIGTILLVAITVVLVAIISAVVMGMTGNVDSAHVVGMKVSTSADNTIDVIFTGGDYTKISTLNATTGTVDSTSTDFAQPAVLAKKYTITITGDNEATTYNIVATIDGKKEIIWTGPLTVKTT